MKGERDKESERERKRESGEHNYYSFFLRYKALPLK